MQKSMTVIIHDSKTAVYWIITEMTWKVLLYADYVEFALSTWFWLTTATQSKEEK